MNDATRAGIRTTEFLVIILAHVLVIVAGFSITAGVAEYHMNTDLLKELMLVDLGYIGVRGGLKMVSTAKAPQEPPSAESVAVKVLEQLRNPTTK